MLNCLGALDAFIPQLLNLLMNRLKAGEAHVAEGKNPMKAYCRTELMKMAAICLYYNPQGALQSLEQLGATASLFQMSLPPPSTPTHTPALSCARAHARALAVYEGRSGGILRCHLIVCRSNTDFFRRSPSPCRVTARAKSPQKHISEVYTTKKSPFWVLHLSSKCPWLNCHRLSRRGFQQLCQRW